MGICGATARPEPEGERIPLPSEDDRPTYSMSKGCQQPGWQIMQPGEEPKHWMWLDGETNKLEDYDSNEVGNFHVDHEDEVMEVKKKTEWAHGEDSDSSDDSDGSGEGDDTQIKLKWKAERKVKFEGDGSSGAIKMKIKGKSNVAVSRNEETHQYQVERAESKTQKAKYKFAWNEEDRKWSVGDTSGNFEIPDCLSFENGSECCSQTMEVKVSGGLVHPKLVPMLAAACHENVHQDAIENAMNNRCEAEGRQIANAMNSAVEMS